jgi:peptidoglycan lytic transglycosylase
MYAMTAAHRTLPFGTRVRVHDLENGQDVVVRINDRGPFVEGRIIDLSYAAAQAMHMLGIARVRLELLGYGEATRTAPARGQAPVQVPPPGIYAVQIGAFRDLANAQKLKQQIPSSFGPVTFQTLEKDDGVLYRVRVGSVSTEEEAERLAAKLRAANYATETFVVRIN